MTTRFLFLYGTNERICAGQISRHLPQFTHFEATNFGERRISGSAASYIHCGIRRAWRNDVGSTTILKDAGFTSSGETPTVLMSFSFLSHTPRCNAASRYTTLCGLYPTIEAHVQSSARRLALAARKPSCTGSPYPGPPFPSMPTIASMMA